MPTPADKGLRRAAKAGEALPRLPALQRLHDNGAVLRRGQLVMIGAIPNAGKSAFAEWLVAQMNVPALYFSADQDEWTTMTRLTAALTGDTTHNVALDPHSPHYVSHLRESKVTFCFDSNPAVEDLFTEVDAYVEIHDEYPHVIVVDNLVNIEGSGELQTDQWIISEMHGLARATKACVLVLVHASEATTKDPFHPPTRRDILNKLSKFPEMVLTVANDPDSQAFKVALVKSRDAKADPQADRPFVLGVDFERMQFMSSPPNLWSRPVGAYNNYDDDE